VVPADQRTELGHEPVGAEDQRRLLQLQPGPAGDQHEGDAGPVQLEQRPGRRQRRGVVLRGEEVAVRPDHRPVEVGVEDLQLASR
jgi:hypothetical protein